MIHEKDPKKRILKAALKEFSTYGFSGARVERIASAAKINKAMLFYYFASKKKLYQRVIREVFQQVSPMIMQLVSSHPSAEEFLERLPDFYVGLAAQNPQFVQMVMLELIQNPRNITSIIAEFFKERTEKGLPGPQQLFQLIRDWKEQGIITEEDPFQFMLNIVSLSFLSFLAGPFLEALFRLSPELSQQSFQEKDFYQKRIKSIVNLLKRGMLA